MKIPKNKKNLSLIFLSILFFALVVIYLGVDKSTYAFQSDSQFREYVLNPEWVEYSHLSFEEQARYEVIPEKFIYQYKKDNSSKISLFRAREEKYPEYYNLNDDGYSTPPDDQGSLGICWAFATASSIETYLLKNGISNSKNPIKISTRQLDYASVHKDYIIEGFNPYQMAERVYPGSAARFNTPFLLLSYGISPVTVDKFNDSIDDMEKKSINEVINLDNVEYNVDSYVNYGTISDYNSQDVRESWIKEIKNHLLNYGSVAISVKGSTPYSAGSCIHVNEDKSNFLINQNGECNETGDGGHAMAIIGYDDNYTYQYCRLDSTTSNDLTNCDNIVSGKGAFILKNSWGNSYPYPYLAYTSNVNGSYGITGVSKKNWDINYDVTKENEGIYGDSLSQITYYKSDREKELLKRVSFYSVSNGNKEYKVYISSNGKDDYHFIGSLTTDKVGLNSISIEDDVILDSDKFSIKITSSNGYIDKIFAYTKESTTSDELMIDTMIKDKKEYEMNDSELLIYSVTKNIVNGGKIDYQLFDESGNDITNLLDISKNYNLNYQVKPTIKIKSVLPQGNLVLKTLYNGVEVDNDILKVKSLKNLWSGGNGTINDPYLISNVDEFKKIFTNEDYLKVNYKLVNDLDFSSVKDWDAGVISNYQAFSGTLDGDNHMIMGLSANSNIPSLFYSLNKSTIKNIVFSEINLEVKESGWGNLLSMMAHDSIIENIIITKSVKIIGNASYAGGLIGTSYNTSFDRIATYATINTNYEYDGVASGIVNKGYGVKLNECYNYGSITAKKSIVGGLVSILGNYSNEEGLIQNSYNFGDISSSLIGGGLVGEGENSVLENTYNVFSKGLGKNIGNIIGSSSYMGIKNSFYLEDYGNALTKDVNNSTTLVNVMGKTSEQLKAKNTYLNFDFDDIWEISSNSYPSLRNIRYLYLMDIEVEKEIHLEVGEKKEIDLSFKPNSASNKKVRYEVENSDLIQLDDNRITALKKGNTILKIYALDGSEIVKEIPITITLEEINLDDYEVIEDNYLKIGENYTPDVFKNNIYQGNKFQIHISSKNPYIGTGDRISIFNQNNTLNKEYTAVILGDITGNGIIDIGDVAKLYQHIRGSFEMKKEFILAGDVYRDSKLELNDVAKLYQYVRGGINSLEGER